MLTGYEHISEANPLVITSDVQLRRIAASVVLSAMNEAAPAPVVSSPTQDKVTTAMAKKMLTDKGYRVTSHNAFKEIVKHLEPKKMGKDYWWKTADIEAIPNKK